MKRKSVRSLRGFAPLRRACFPVAPLRGDDLQAHRMRIVERAQADHGEHPEKGERPN